MQHTIHNLDHILKTKTQRSKSCWDSENRFNHVPKLRPKLIDVQPSPMILELNHKKRSWDYSPSKELQNKYFILNSTNGKDTEIPKRGENLNISLHNNANDSSKSILDENDTSQNQSKSSASDLNDSECSDLIPKKRIIQKKNSLDVDYEKQIQITFNQEKAFTNDKDKINIMEFDIDDKLTQFNNKISLNDFDYLLTDKSNKNEILIGDNNNNNNNNEIYFSNDLKAMDNKNFNGDAFESSDKKVNEKDKKTNLLNQLGGETYFYLSNYNLENFKCCKDNCLNENKSLFCKNRTNRTSILNHIQTKSN